MSDEIDEIDAIMTEVSKTREAADRMANGEQPDEADEVRVLAGMVRQLADQFRRLGNLSGASHQASAANVSTQPQIDNQPAVDRDGRLVARDGKPQTEGDVVHSESDVSEPQFEPSTQPEFENSGHRESEPHLDLLPERGVGGPGDRDASMGQTEAAGRN